MRSCGGSNESDDDRENPATLAEVFASVQADETTLGPELSRKLAGTGGWRALLPPHELLYGLPAPYDHVHVRHHGGRIDLTFRPKKPEQDGA